MSYIQKLEKIKVLADAMYHAAFYITTDASHLKKAMYDYHQFILQNFHKEEHISEELEEAASRYAKEEYNSKSPATLPNRCRGCYAPLMYAFKAGSKWQKKQDQSTIELAEDHAMFVGKEKMRDEMVEKACKYLDKLIEVLNNYGHTLKKEHIIYGLKRAMQEK